MPTPREACSPSAPAGPAPAPQRGQRRARRALAALAGHLRAWGLAGAQLAVDPLLRAHADGFSDVAYQVHLVTPASGASQLVAVGARPRAPRAASPVRSAHPPQSWTRAGRPSRAPARAGGRWDGLLQAAWAPFALSTGAPPCAAGVTLNVDRLLDCLPAARAPALRASQARCAQQREGRDRALPLTMQGRESGGARVAAGRTTGVPRPQRGQGLQPTLTGTALLCIRAGAGGPRARGGARAPRRRRCWCARGAAAACCRSA